MIRDISLPVSMNVKKCKCNFEFAVISIVEQKDRTYSIGTRQDCPYCPQCGKKVERRSRKQGQDMP